MKKFKVTGMTCAACSARVEKAVSAVGGVTECSVNLLTNSMKVEGGETASIIKAVVDAGYGADIYGDKVEIDSKDPFADETTPILKKRLIASLGFLVILMYFSMGHTMLGLPLPSFFESNYIAIGLIQLLLAAAVIVINKEFFINGIKGVIRRSPNMDTLVSMGSAAAFCYSSVLLFLMTAVDDPERLKHLAHGLYFESAAMILTLITVGKMLEAKSKGKTTDALKKLIDLTPKTATVIKNGENIVVLASEVQRGDIFVVRPGESFPADGVIVEGRSVVNESALTGESIPVDKTVKDKVSAATVNVSGFLKCEAQRVGEDTALYGIIRMVSDAAASKPPIAKVADKVSGVFVPIVILIAVVTFAVWSLFGYSVGFSLARAISVLVISCPCALGLATPVAIMVGSGVGAKNGVLFKNATSLERIGKIEVAVFDKTGTVTKGEPSVTDIIPAEGVESEELLFLAASLEAKSEHPLGRAVVNYAEQNGIIPSELTEFSAIIGNGAEAWFDGQRIIGGSVKFIESQYAVPQDFILKTHELSKKGKTPMLFVKGNELLGIIAVADTVNQDSREAIGLLKKMGIKTVLLTGDNKNTAEAVAEAVGVDEVVSEVLPDTKEQYIKDLSEKSLVAMVGDGINDAPALTRADVGVAVGNGTDIAIDSADIVLPKRGLSDVVTAVGLGRSVLRVIHENLFWAFVYNCIGIPLAAGVFIPLFGWSLEPMFGAAAMSLSSFCVVTNALRLNFYKPKLINKTIKNDKEKIKMEKIIKVEGMMCMHCEAHVKNALEALSEVESAVADHKAGIVTVKLSADISDVKLKNVIEAEGYKVS